MGKKTFVNEDKDKRLKTQRETIITLRREIKKLERQVRELEKKLNPAPKEEKQVRTPKATKLSPEQEREAARERWAKWRAALGTKDEE